MPGPDGRPQFVEETRNGYRVRRYRPRIEGLFARIERWTLKVPRALWHERVRQ